MDTFLHLVHEYEFDLPDRFDGDPRTPASYVIRPRNTYSRTVSSKRSVSRSSITP